jgi:IS30 family transposase
MGYTHLSILERSSIAVYRTLHWSTRQIAAQLGRHHATIAREYRRGRNEDTYHATQAHQRAIVRRTASRPQGRYTTTLATHISALLHKTWSPEQIAAFHRINAIPSVSYATIYRWMYAGRLPLVSVHQLRHKGKRRAPAERRGRFSGGRSIHTRPKEVYTRRTFGHWEADTIVSGRGKSRACMATFVERYSRWYVAIPMADRTAQAMHAAIRTLVHHLPVGACKTLTVDRGKEFAAHQAIDDGLHVPIYFADAYAAWQRGTNENSNGLLREFFPKGKDLATVSADTLAAALKAINQRPRKCLHWRSAESVFLHALSHLT